MLFNHRLGLSKACRKAGKSASRRTPNQKRPPRSCAVEALEDRTLLSAAVWTNKPDYAPQETVRIGGSGFPVSETVELQVLRADGLPNVGPGHETWGVTDGGEGDLDGLRDGRIQTTWYVYDQFYGARLQLTAAGLTSGLTAETTFTDGFGLTTLRMGSASAAEN